MYVHCLKNVAFEIGLEVKGGMNTNISFFFLRFYLFIFREKGREEERQERNIKAGQITLISSFLHAHSWGPGPQPRHVSQPGMEPVTFCLQAGIQCTEPHWPG